MLTAIKLLEQLEKIADEGVSFTLNIRHTLPALNITSHLAHSNGTVSYTTAYDMQVGGVKKALIAAIAAGYTEDVTIVNTKKGELQLTATQLIHSKFMDEQVAVMGILE